MSDVTKRIPIATCGTRGVLGPRAICGAVSVHGSFCGSDKGSKCPNRTPISQKQALVLLALADDVEFKVTPREHDVWYKRWTFEADHDGLRSPLYTSMAVWALLHRRVLKVEDGKLVRAK